MKVIIQGTQEQNTKIIKVIKDKFPGISKKAVVKDDEGTMTIIEIIEDVKRKGEFTYEELDKALLCCSAAVRNCVDCPLKGVPNCSERVLTDSAVMVADLIGDACKGEKQ